MPTSAFPSPPLPARTPLPSTTNVPPRPTSPSKTPPGIGRADPVRFFEAQLRLPPPARPRQHPGALHHGSAVPIQRVTKLPERPHATDEFSPQRGERHPVTVGQRLHRREFA